MIKDERGHHSGTTAKALTEARTESAKEQRKSARKTGKDYCSRRDKKLVERKDQNSNTITSTQTVEQLIKIQIKSATKSGCEEATEQETQGLVVVGNNDETRKVVKKDKASALQSQNQTNPRSGGTTLIQIKSATKSGHEEATQANQGVVVNYAQYDRSGKGYKSQQDRVYDPEGLMATLGSHSLEQKVNITQGTSIRRLTEIECERLQGFPDNWTEYGNYDGEVKRVSMTQRYKMLGNAVTVDIVEMIANRLK